ncbi:MAG: outer membrane protein transport protein [Myxococcota bacterium]
MCALTVVVGEAPANAAGFYIADVGARGLGRGGAFVAAPDSLLAASYNPAGLSLLRGLHIEASIAAVQLNAEISRQCPCLDPATDATLESLFAPANTSTPLAIPYVAIGYGFDWLNSHVAIAAWEPNSGRNTWGDIPDTSVGEELFRLQSEAQSQRYSAFEVANFEANVALSYAFEPLPKLRVGVSGFLFFSGSDQSLSVWANSNLFAQPAENTNFDVPLDVRLPPTSGFGWGAGLSYEILPGLSIGTSFRAERRVKGEGTLDAQLPIFFLSFEDARIEGDAVDIELNIAPIWRGGIQYRWPEVLTVEAAVVWEGWSTHDRIVARPRNVQVKIPSSPNPLVIPELILPRDWNDTWSLRLGGEVHAVPWVDLRWGYFFESSAVPASTVSAARIDRPKHGFSLGAAYTWRGLTMELSATYVHLVPISIGDSQLRVTGVFPVESDGTSAAVGSERNLSVIGNGDISGHYLIGAVSVGAAFDGF